MYRVLIAGASTSRSLNAALLLSPWTLASRAKESLPCLLFHRVEDEDRRVHMRGALSIRTSLRTQLVCRHDVTLRYLKNACAACCDSM